MLLIHLTHLRYPRVSCLSQGDPERGKVARTSRGMSAVGVDQLYSNQGKGCVFTEPFDVQNETNTLVSVLSIFSFHKLFAKVNCSLTRCEILQVLSLFKRIHNPEGSNCTLRTGSLIKTHLPQKKVDRCILIFTFILVCLNRQ